jgi:D-glycero-alpha-D-manno-heptose 1-phosphate guanylyltransferase
MKAIVLAGGLGTRLRSVLGDIPKPMAPVNGRPFLEFLLLMLKEWGVSDIVLSIGHRKEVIEEFAGDGRAWGLSILYAREDLPLGTGGAIREAMKQYPDNEYLVLNGDSYFEVDFHSFLFFHRMKEANATIALTSLDDVDRYGRIELNEAGEITAFHEKQGNGPGTVNAGIYLLDRSVLTAIPNTGPVSFEREVLPGLIGAGLYGSVHRGFFIDIGIPDDYRKFCELQGVS